MKTHNLILNLVLLMCIIAGTLVINPVFASYDLATNTYLLSDSKDIKYQANFTLIKNTDQCLSYCEAIIKISSTNLSKTIASLILNSSVTTDNKAISNLYIIKNDTIIISSIRKPNIQTISKSGIEEHIKINNNYDWILSIGDTSFDKWAWWNSSWNYRACFNITNINDTKTNYPIKIFLNNSWGLAHFNFANVTDLRFTDNATNPLIFWHEKNDSTINNSYEYVALNLSAGVNQTICMYYNNPTATSLSNFNSTFPNGNSITTFFDFSNDLQNYGYSQLNGTAYNGATPYPNKQYWINNSYYFNGTYQSINSSDSALYDTQTFSITFMANSSTNERQSPISKFWDDATRQWYIGFNDANGVATNQIEFSVGYTGSPQFINCTAPAGILYDGLFHYYSATYNSGVAIIYLDGNQLCNKTIGYTMLYNNANLVIGQQSYGSGKDMPFSGTVYNVKFYNKTLSGLEINQTYISQYPNIQYGQEELAESPPSITFNSQSPSYITPTTLFSQRVNISYNISDTDSTPIINNTVQLYYKVNTTTLDGAIYVNGSLTTGFSNVSYDSASGETYYFSLGDSKVYPASYNIDQIYMQQTPKLNFSLSGSNNYIFEEILNVSPSNLTVIEFYALPPASSSILHAYVCNNSKVISIQSSPSCFLACDITNTQPYNHTHSAYSKHYVCAYSVNLTNNLTKNNVKVRETMYIYLRPSNTQTWKVEYISNTSRVNATTYSSNSGNTYTELSGTIDAHFHFYKYNEMAYYYAYANDSIAETCSSIRNITINSSSFPPNPPNVWSPNSSLSYYKESDVPINYTQATSNDNNTINKYNITLYSNSLTELLNVVSNNYPNLSYSWNASAIATGTYIIGVEACTVSNLCSTGFGEEFLLRSAFALNPNKREKVYCIREIVTL